MVENIGRILRINLSTGLIRESCVDDKVRIDYVGGRGFGINYLYHELNPGADPLGEHNKLIMLNGVLTGTSAQAVARWMVYTKSPLTGGVARSVVGGDFGAWLKFAGYDLVLIEGKAESPVYVHLTADNCEIHNAGEIWGKNTRETQEWLADHHGKNTRSACIGPAGENLVRYAAIVTGRRTAGRCGTGTVMGSKNLKAVAITAQRNLQIHDLPGFKKLAKEQIDIIINSKGYKHHREIGTTGNQDHTNQMGIFPVKNFRYGQHSEYEKISNAEYRKLRVGDSGCYSCSTRCGKVHSVSDGPYAGAWSEGPEYETIWAFNGPIENSNIEATVYADQLCDDFGMDTISTGSCIGFAYELYEKGILNKNQTDGLELTYGNHQAMVKLIKKIAFREGFGDILAEGSMRAAALIGKDAENYAIHVKGLELPAYEPRGAKSQGFNYATSNIGASHNYGYARQELFGLPEPREVDRFAETENADIVIYNQNRTAMIELGVVCSFSSVWGWLPAVFGKMLVAVTGISQFADLDYLYHVGERIVNLERAFNVREGFNRKQDTLPVRLTREPLITKGAPGNGQIVRELDKFLDRYYQLRGWTKQGIPSSQKLIELNLDYVLNDFTRLEVSY